MSRARRVGILGGTFDPPHIGHLVAAVNVRAALGLDEVLLMVANVPWQKVGTRVISSSTDRLRMVELALGGAEGLTVRDDEIIRGGDSITADTLEALRADEPETAFHVIVGSDVAAQLDTWKRAGDVSSMATVVVYPRPPVEHLTAPDGWSAIHVDVPPLQISSTDLRRRVGAGEPIDYLVPPAVVDHIVDNGLYR